MNHQYKAPLHPDIIEADEEEVLPETQRDIIKELKEKISTIEMAYKKPEPIGDETYYSVLKKKYYTYFEGTPQIKKEALRIFNSMCILLDKKLTNTSILQMEKRIKFVYYPTDSILFALYTISKTSVIHYYRHNMNPISPYYWRSIEMSAHLNIQFLKEDLKALVSMCSPADEKTRLFLNLTDNGYPKAWWDVDGILREEKAFTSDQEKILGISVGRSTKLWNSKKIRKEILRFYFELLDMLIDNQEIYKFKKTSIRTLERISNFDVSYNNRQRKKEITGSLLKISENSVRSLLPKTIRLSIEAEQEVLQKFVPANFLPEILNKITDYRDHPNKELQNSLFEECLKLDPDNPKLIVDMLNKTDDIEFVEVYLAYYHKDRELFVKISKVLIKNKESQERLLQVCFCLEKIKGEALSRDLLSLRNKTLSAGNESLYAKALKDPLDARLLAYIASLTQPVRKTINLKEEHIRASKNELNDIIQVIENYIGEEEQEEVVHNVIESSKSKDRQLLNILLEKEFLTLEEAQVLADTKGMLLTGYINEINMELYEYFEDQVIVIKEGEVWIDSFYREQIKELVSHESKN